MRLVLLVALLAGGCLTSSGGSVRPAVIPKLSELPADSGRRDAVLDSANQTSHPEQSKSGKPLSKKERRALTSASFAAAVLGSLFSTTENVTLGGATTVDENEVVAPTKPTAKREKDDAAAGTEAPAPAQPSTDPLVPWVKLKK